MPYADPERRRAADRERKRRSRIKEVQTEIDLANGEQVDFAGRPQVEDAEAAYGDESRETVIAAAVHRRYGKSRTWACIMYLDSCPPDWEDKLRQIGVGFAVSPLHDKDVRDDGSIKKEHYHVILNWPGGSTTYRAVAGIARDVLHGTIPVPLVSPRGYYRYFTHLDNPSKAQYDEADIVRGNGFDIDDFSALTVDEQIDISMQIEDMIIAEGIVEYWDLMMYIRTNCSRGIYDFARRNTVYLSAMLRSRRHVLAPKPAVEPDG